MSVSGALLLPCLVPRHGSTATIPATAFCLCATQVLSPPRFAPYRSPRAKRNPLCSDRVTVPLQVALRAIAVPRLARRQKSNDSPARVVDDLLDQATDVAVALGKVERTELGRRDTVVRVRAEDSAALTLVADDCGVGRRRRASRAKTGQVKRRQEEQGTREVSLRVCGGEPALQASRGTSTHHVPSLTVPTKQSKGARARRDARRRRRGGGETSKEIEKQSQHTVSCSDVCAPRDWSHPSFLPLYDP